MASNDQNLVVYDSSGNILNAWCEAGCSGTATNTRIWVNLGSDIITTNGGTFLIYLGFYPTSTNNYSPTGNWGAYPLFTSTYAQYDNGGRVFTFYDDFAGSTLSSSWTVQDCICTVNNGITLIDTVPGWGGIYSSNMAGSSNDIDVLFNSGSSDTGVYESFGITNTLSASDLGHCTASDMDYQLFETRQGQGQFWIENCNAGTMTDVHATEYTPSSNTYYLATGYLDTANFLTNSTSVATLTATAGTQDLVLAAGASTTYTDYYYRVRVAPPNNVMPTVTSEESITSTSTGTGVITPTGTSASLVPSIIQMISCNIQDVSNPTCSLPSVVQKGDILVVTEGFFPDQPTDSLGTNFSLYQNPYENEPTTSYITEAVIYVGIAPSTGDDTIMYTRSNDYTLVSLYEIANAQALQSNSGNGGANGTSSVPTAPFTSIFSPPRNSIVICSAEGQNANGDGGSYSTNSNYTANGFANFYGGYNQAGAEYLTRSSGSYDCQFSVSGQSSSAWAWSAAYVYFPPD